MAKDHFVPRHYLRQFAITGTECIAAVQVSPYRSLGAKGIGGQCQAVDFEEGDKALSELLYTTENTLAPTLVKVIQKENYTEPELNALRWLAVFLHIRTRKSVEARKVLPRHIDYWGIQSAIKSGRLPPYPDGRLTEEMFDYKGLLGVVVKNAAIPLRMEMQTLACKLLKAASGASFITSDNPVVVLNQFCASVEPHRSFVGFSRAGFQLLLSINPKLCLLFYDAKVYKVGSPRHQLTCICKEDVEVVNSLQIQAAEDCVYFHEPRLESEIRDLVSRYAHLRIPVKANLRTLPGNKPGEELLHFRQASVNVPKPWAFSRLRRHVKFKIGDRRNPAWTALADELMEDLGKNPNSGDIPARIERILADPTSLKNIRVR